MIMPGGLFGFAVCGFFKQSCRRNEQSVTKKCLVVTVLPLHILWYAAEISGRLAGFKFTMSSPFRQDYGEKPGLNAWRCRDKRGVMVSPQTVWCALHQMGLAIKIQVVPAEPNHPGVTGGQEIRLGNA
ncbi:MAG: hypothetical protein NTV55_11560 [Planctomycetota bacterium]|nr:hypothetical protein [Planctomycetota bacterium]